VKRKGAPLPEENPKYAVQQLPQFAEMMARLCPRYARLQAAIDAACIVLAIRPSEVFTSIVVGRDEWKAFGVEAAPGVPALNVYYRIDEANKTVYLIRGDECGGDEPDDEN
jgi:hypothetical protein